MIILKCKNCDHPVKRSSGDYMQNTRYDCLNSECANHIAYPQGYTMHSFIDLPGWVVKEITPDTKCYICGEFTDQACSDCRIDFNVSIYVCHKTECQQEHDKKCSYALRARIRKLEAVE